MQSAEKCKTVCLSSLLPASLKQFPAATAPATTIMVTSHLPSQSALSHGSKLIANCKEPEKIEEVREIVKVRCLWRVRVQRVGQIAIPTQSNSNPVGISHLHHQS